MYLFLMAGLANQKPRYADSALGRDLTPDPLSAHWSLRSKPTTRWQIRGVSRCDVRCGWCRCSRCSGAPASRRRIALTGATLARFTHHFVRVATSKTAEATWTSWSRWATRRRYSTSSNSKWGAAAPSCQSWIMWVNPLLLWKCR